MAIESQEQSRAAARAEAREAAREAEARELQTWQGQVEELRGLVSDRALTGETLLLNMGPHHPSTHGVLRLLLELDGEEIVTCLPDIGYLHTGIEKNIESKTYEKAVTLTDRMDYLSPMSNNMVFCMAIEKLVELDVPPRAQAVRVICLELSRIASHLVWLGTHALDMGAMSVFLYGFRERERILDMFEMLSGQRMMGSYFRPGGLWRDITAEFGPALADFLEYMPPKVEDYELLLRNNPLWIDRTYGVGVVEPEQALAWGMSGPSLRGSGVNWDIRKAEPYSGYEQYEFNVPLGDHGDVYDRFMVRIEEMKESLSIIRQAWSKLPQGAFRSDNRKFVPPPRAELGQSMEAVIHHFKLWTEGFSVPDEEVYVAIESPRGEIGCYLHGTGGNTPRRVHFKTPSFMHISALGKMAEGHFIADLVGIIGSIDIVLGDSDR
ncbi:MAG: NADH dehydrogenase (quinone) subunit D [Chloroflexi bacterium]|nr:NADH dehydrogenase (quinone) subunit D [Chloroflexota bacterium]